MDEDLKNQNDSAPESDESFDQGQPRKSKLIFLGSVVILPLIAAIILVVFVIFPKYQSQAQESPNPKQKTESKKKKEIGQIYTISDLTVNPRNSLGRRYAVFEIALEVPNQKAIDKLKRYHPIIMDRFLEYLRNRSVQELSGEMSVDQLKQEMIGLVNEILNEDLVMDLYFTRFVLE